MYPTVSASDKKTRPCVVRRPGRSAGPTAIAQHVDVLRAGPRAWNAWRRDNPGIVPVLDGLALSVGERQFGRVQGGPINLSRAEIRRAQLDQATFIEANLMGAVLTEADLSEARLEKADLRGAKLAYADLRGAQLEGANLCGADLRLATGLTQAQIDRTLGDRRTTLPPGLTPPREWLQGAQPGLEQPVAQADRPHAGGAVVADPYEVLGVSPGTPIQDIRIAWLRLVEELHPDGSPPEEQPVSERLKVINQAYQQLKDRERQATRKPAARSLFRAPVLAAVLLAVIAAGALVAAVETYLAAQVATRDVTPAARMSVAGS
jgi:DnaJ-domain-containing protein 1